MTEKIVIIGAGGFGREVASMIKRINKLKAKWEFLGFFDDDADGKPKGSKNEYGPILGTVSELNNITEKMNVAIAVGSPKAVKAIVSKLDSPYLSFPNLIAAEASILDEDNYVMGKGNILSSFASISCNVHIGNFNIFNNRVSMGHDAVIGNYNVCMTAVRISGGTVVGDGNLFGVSSIVIPGVKVLDGNTISPGSVIMRNTKSNSTYVGNPAKLFKF